MQVEEQWSLKASVSKLQLQHGHNCCDTVLTLPYQCVLALTWKTLLQDEGVVDLYVHLVFAFAVNLAQCSFNGKVCFVLLRRALAAVPLLVPQELVSY